MPDSFSSLSRETSSVSTEEQIFSTINNLINPFFHFFKVLIETSSFSVPSQVLESSSEQRRQSTHHIRSSLQSLLLAWAIYFFTVFLVPALILPAGSLLIKRERGREKEREGGGKGNREGVDEGERREKWREGVGNTDWRFLMGSKARTVSQGLVASWRDCCLQAIPSGVTSCGLWHQQSISRHQLIAYLLCARQCARHRESCGEHIRNVV